MKRYIVMIFILLLALVTVPGCADSKEGKAVIDKDKTEVRVLSEGIVFEGKGHGFEEEHTEQVPIVLWEKAEPAAVLALHITTKPRIFITETHEFIKRSLDGKQKSLREKLSAATDDYPLTYKAKVKDLYDQKEMRAANSIEAEHILTADVNGDGVEELLIPKKHCDIDVYDTRKRLFNSRAWDHFLPLEQYELVSIKSHIASLENRDVVFYAFNRTLAGGISSRSAEEKQRARQEEVSAIFRIDAKGISQVVPLGVNWILKDITAVGALNYPGSKDIDEIVVLHKMEEDRKNNVYLTRLKPDGQVIDKPRIFYQPFDNYGNAKFIFVPQSRQIILRQGPKDLYFVTPEKPVNWARRVSMPKPFQYAGMLRGERGMVVLVRDGLSIFAMDEEGWFNILTSYGKLHSSKEKQSLYTIRLDSDRHRLADFVVSKQAVDKPEYLVVQSRERQNGVALPWQDYLAAAKKYMKDDVVEAKLQELKQKSERYLDPETAEEKYKQKFGKAMKLPNREDVKKHFPEYYVELQAQSEKKYQILIVTSLLELPNKDRINNYKDYEGYCQWSETQKVADDREMVFTLMADFKEGKKIRLPGYNYYTPQLGTVSLRMPTTGFRRYHGFLAIVAIGQKAKSDTPCWLYITNEGGRR